MNFQLPPWGVERENCEDWSLVRHALLASIQPLVLLLLLPDVLHRSYATFIRRNSLVGEMAVTAPSNKMSHTALHYSLRLDVSKPHYRLIRLSPQLPLLLPFIVSNQVWSEVTIATLYFFHQLPLTRRAPYQWFHENSMHKVLQKFFDLFWTHLSCRLDGTK